MRERVLGLDASTLHRLLGWRPDSHSRFRHDRGNRLPYDVVIVDETSMVSLSLMARLIEAVRPDARLILVGDPGQLTSIEAGAVLGDIVGPADRGPIVVLDRVHRYGARDRERRGGDPARRRRRRGGGAGRRDVGRGPGGRCASASSRPRGRCSRPRETATARARSQALGAFRVLCAHRRGPYGVSAWTARIEEWIGNEAGGDWYVGRPLLVTENDYGLRLFNGDTGVVIASGPGRVSAAFERHGEVVEFSPTRLAAVDTVYAMTVHKSQGSQFDTAAVLLPEPTSPILTRELLYTAVTRAREELILVGTEESVRAAVERPIARASGLRRRLWDVPS